MIKGCAMISKDQYIMLIDDNQFFLESLSEALYIQGFQNHMFDDPAKAIASYIPDIYPVLIIDYNMPTLNGIEVLHKIKQVNPQAKIIIYTGLPVKSLKKKIIENGAIELHKSVKLIDLVSKLEIIIEEIKKEEKANDIT